MTEEELIHRLSELKKKVKKISAPVSTLEIEAAEKDLGFSLPPLF